jgi:hypothetical protein
MGAVTSRRACLDLDAPPTQQRRTSRGPGTVQREGLDGLVDDLVTRQGSSRALNAKAT